MSLSHAATTTAPQPLPLRHRLYARYCDGLSAAAIAREFGLDRQTVTRHLRIIEEQLAREHTSDLGRLRIRAVQAQYRLQSTALEALAHEEALEAASLAAQAAARAAGEPLPPLYRAQRARLLAAAAHAARTAAQLEGLFHEPSAALVQAHSWITPFRPQRFDLHRAEEPVPDLPLDAYDPTDPDDLPDDDPPDDPGDPSDARADPGDPPASLDTDDLPDPSDPRDHSDPSTASDHATAGDTPDRISAVPPIITAPGDPPTDAAPASPLSRTVGAPDGGRTAPENPVAFCGMPASRPHARRVVPFAYLM